MNTKLLLLAVSVAALGSCTTLYKTGQTPDDVYYSPARPYGESQQEDRVQRTDTRRYYNSEDAAIRMGIYDPRWRSLNDYAYTPYSYGFNHGYYYNPYFWPYPVYSPVFVAPSNPKITTPRMNNLGSYGSIPGYSNTQVNPKTGRTAPVRTYNNDNGSAVGNALRKVLGSDNYNNNSNNSSNNNSNNNTRSYTPSSSSSSSSGSKPASSGSISRPPRGGN